MPMMRAPSDSSIGKRRTGGRKRKAAGGSSSSSSTSNISVVTCEGHATKLLSGLDTQRRTYPELATLPVGLTLRTSGGTDVPAQTNIMAAASPYVLSKLTRWQDEQEAGGGSGGRSSSSSLSSAASSSSSSSPSAVAAADDDAKLITITIPDLDAAALNAAVHFAYTGTVALDLDNKDAALRLIAGFQILDMEDAIETAQTWVGDNLDSTSALRVQQAAESLHLGVLKARADEYIDQNFEAVTKTEEWQMLPAEAVGEVLARDELRPGGEIQVFHALVRWAKRGAKRGDGGGGCEGGAAGGGGESKEGDQDEGQQFADLLGRCVRTSLLNVRASLLSSKEILRVVMEEPLVRGSNTALRSMVDVLRERVEPLDLT